MLISIYFLFIYMENVTRLQPSPTTMPNSATVKHLRQPDDSVGVIFVSFRCG